MPADRTGRGVIVVVAAAAVCCAAAALLVGAGLLAADGGLLGSPEVAVAAAVVAVAGVWRLAVAIAGSGGDLERYDTLVIGGGMSGLPLALGAAGHGRTAFVEREPPLSHADA